MSVKIYNTIAKEVQDLGPMGQKLNMFVCGPTVYDYIHIGNARTFTVFDMVAKYLRYRGYGVTYLQNITDIDNKIIHKAHESGRTAQEVAKEFENAFLEDVHALHITSVDTYARASDYVPEIIAQIKHLQEAGYAYAVPAVELSEPDAVSSSDNQDVYFDVTRYEEKFSGEYGKLSNQLSNELEEGVRVELEKNKKGPRDFVFGPQYEIHGGGQDLIFPHHEAEIAQQQAASGKVPFVQHWIHTGFLTTKSEKMSKSLGNITPARELLKEYSPTALRFYLLSGHYRAPLDFSDQALRQAEAGVMRIHEFLERLKLFEDHNPMDHSADKEIKDQFNALYKDLITAMDDDLNTPKALGVLFDVIRLGNQYIDEQKIDLHSVKEILYILDFYHRVMGIVPIRTTTIPEEVKTLVSERQEAKENKEFDKADQLRDQIAALGYQIDDTPYGPLVKKK
ncbi:MAG: cysteine--tRNA ligase [Candidatus Yanofskybacteria bacterium]|nr:cysteine--tRNA ligase [Candidatus Yanofskybacteria bacterium]